MSPDSAIQLALQEYFRINQSSATGVQYRALSYDLNADGYPDAILQMNWCDKTGCVWLLASRLTGRLSLPESTGGGSRVHC